MSSIRKPAKLCLVLKDRLRGALVSAFRDGWLAKERADRSADFGPILDHWAEGIEKTIKMLERREE